MKQLYYTALHCTVVSNRVCIVHPGVVVVVVAVDIRIVAHLVVAYHLVLDTAVVAVRDTVVPDIAVVASHHHRTWVVVDREDCTHCMDYKPSDCRLPDCTFLHLDRLYSAVYVLYVVSMIMHVCA